MTILPLLLLYTLPVALTFAPSPTTVHTKITTRGISARLLPPQQQQPEPSFHSVSPHLRSTTPRLQPTRLSVSLSDQDLEEATQRNEDAQVEESWEDDSKLVEAVMLLAWAASISAFILINNFIGPWPEQMAMVPERVWFVLHMLGGMLFGGCVSV